MQSRSLDDKNSWWFFAAIHGEHISKGTFPGWGLIPGPPAVPTSPLPSRSVRDRYWNQCQHQSWYFPPWHRGYLYALENQIRSSVIALGGPTDWALPYWDYLGPGNQNKLPPAFAEHTLPDGSPNPLYVYARFGPENDSNVYVKIPPISTSCQNETVYTKKNSLWPGYGGPDTGFSHNGGKNGSLESNPHNLVHVQVGGKISPDLWGLMADPGIAALDPIFYLHHCNIDRMWESWNTQVNDNPSDINWLKGPASVGERVFIMPMPGGNTWTYTPEEVDRPYLLDYNYDKLLPVMPRIPRDMIAERFTKLGIKITDGFADMLMDLGEKSELIGANRGSLELSSRGIRTKVVLDKTAFGRTQNSFLEASVTRLPDYVYLQMENVKGGMDANTLEVLVNERPAGYISLFGLRNASNKDGRHGGQGLTFIFDITNIIDELYLEKSLDLDSLDVIILPEDEIPDGLEITVGRIGIYREQQG